MKIAIVSNDFRVYWRGRLVFLQSALAANNIELNAVELFGKGSPYDFDEFKDQYSWWRCLFPDSDASLLSVSDIRRRLFRYLDSLNPDVIITSPITFFAGALGLRWAKKRQKKYIMFDDAKPRLQFKRNFLVRWIRDTITSQADALWLPSTDYNKEYPNLNSSTTLFFYGFNCVDNNFFKSSSSKVFGSKNIICIARLVPVKNLDKLLQAWELIESNNNDWKLCIIGDGPLYHDLVRAISQLKLKRVEIKGAVNYGLLPQYLHKAEALILPSLSETWGLVVNEAMAAGLPILLSDKVNAAESLLKNDVNGYSFDPTEVTDIVKTINKFLNLSNSEKLKMSERSLQIIEHMDYKSMADNLLKALSYLSNVKFKKPGLIAGLFVNLWSGKHDISAWNVVKP